MDRMYLCVVPVPGGWAIRGVACAGRNLYATCSDAVQEAQRLALSLHRLSLRPTGVRTLTESEAWLENIRFGEN